MPGNPVSRTPMKPVSRITSRMSVNGAFRKWPHNPALTAHLMFWLAGSFWAAPARVAESDARNARLFMNGSTGLIDYQTSLNYTDIKEHAQGADSQIMPLASRLEFLRSTQNPDGGWGFFPGKQSWLEPTAYALMALHGHASSGQHFERGWKLMRSWQLS